jgi:hypothetical protein
VNFLEILVLKPSDNNGYYRQKDELFFLSGNRSSMSLSQTIVLKTSIVRQNHDEQSQ